jgi:hypothetical protein
MKKLDVPTEVLEWLWKQKDIIIAVAEGKELFIIRGKLLKDIIDISEQIELPPEKVIEAKVKNYLQVHKTEHVAQ